MLIGICDRTCCGKDSVSQKIASVNRQVLHMNCDLFFKSKTDCTFKGYTSWEEVNTLRIDYLSNVIHSFKNGRSIILKDRSPWWGAYDCELFEEDLEKKNVIIFQGFLLLALKEIADQFDYRMFIDITDETLLYRRLLRNGNFDEIHYIHDVIIPASHSYYEDQKGRADIILDSNSVSIKDITSTVLNHINSKVQHNESLIDPFNGKSWTVHPGDLLCDHEWHPIDFMNLKVHVQNCEQWMDDGNIVEGNTFQYRKNSNTGDYEIRLSMTWENYRHIFRYTREDTMPKRHTV